VRGARNPEKTERKMRVLGFAGRRRVWGTLPELKKTVTSARNFFSDGRHSFLRYLGYFLALAAAASIEEP
jgi:hypothetical protein